METRREGWVSEAGGETVVTLQQMALRHALDLVRSASSQLVTLSVREHAEGIQALKDLARTDSDASKLSQTLREAENWLEAIREAKQ